MTHPLDGAFARVNRADVHIQELKILIERFRKDNEDKLVPHEELTGATFVVKPGQAMSMEIKSRPVPDIPEDISILVGEVIYNLRAALDYLIYELAIKDSGSIQDGTQFLIEDSKSGFDARAKRYLFGLSNAHIQGIEALQPYCGCEWTKTLRDISNPDKHRHLIAVNSQWNQLSVFGGDVAPEDPGNIIRGGGVFYTEDHFNLQYPIYVTFEDGTPVVKVLEIVKGTISGVIKTFEPDF